MWMVTHIVDIIYGNAMSSLNTYMNDVRDGRHHVDLADSIIWFCAIISLTTHSPQFCATNGSAFCGMGDATVRDLQYAPTHTAGWYYYAHSLILCPHPTQASTINFDGICAALSHAGVPTPRVYVDVTIGTF